MTKQKILQTGANYSFHSYFELPNDTDEILAEFGYSFRRARLSLPRTTQPIPRVSELRQQLEETIPVVTLSSEAAKREILIAPVLSRVAVICQALLRIEYPLKVSDQLQGTLDYLIQTQQSLIVVEAKRDDLTRGFTQLGVEMIALAQMNETLVSVYGAVTIGDVWVFGKLEQSIRMITRDISSYTLPDDLEVLLQILLGILRSQD
jgi:hypothetical protein